MPPCRDSRNTPARARGRKLHSSSPFIRSFPFLVWGFVLLSGNSHTIRLILKGVVYDSAGSRAPREPGNRPDWLTPAHCHHPGGAPSRGHSPPPPAPPAPAPTGLCARPTWTCLPRTFPTESITACGLARLASRYGRMTFHVRMAQSDLPLVPWRGQCDHIQQVFPTLQALGHRCQSQGP